MDIMHNLIRPAVKTSINRQLSGYLDHKYSTNCNVLDCNLQSSLEIQMHKLTSMRPTISQV